MRFLKWTGLYYIGWWFAASMSVDSNPAKGGSARKLTALSLNACIIYLIKKYSESPQWTHFETVLIILLSGASFFLALFTASDLIKGFAIFKGQKMDTTVVSTETMIKESKKEIKKDGDPSLSDV